MTRNVTLKVGNGTVNWQAPANCAIVAYAISLTGGSTNAGADNATAILSLNSAPGTADGVSEINVAIVNLALVGVAAGASAQSVTQNGSTWVRLAAGQSLYLRHVTVASGTSVACAQVLVVDV